MGASHDRLLGLTEEVADEDPFDALRLLQTVKPAIYQGSAMF
jgi:hypothetical protein